MSTLTNKEENLPTLRAAFRTTVSSGQDGRYTMQFAFQSLDEMHLADDEWHKFITVATSPSVYEVRVRHENGMWLDWFVYEDGYTDLTAQQYAEQRNGEWRLASPSVQGESIDSDGHFSALLGDMHPLSKQAVIAFVNENYVSRVGLGESIDGGRAAFEVWAKRQYGDGPECKRTDSGRYLYGHVQKDWELWQAARLARIAAPQIEPPLTSTEDCLERVALLLEQQGRFALSVGIRSALQARTAAPSEGLAIPTWQERVKTMKAKIADLRAAVAVEGAALADALRHVGNLKEQRAALAFATHLVDLTPEQKHEAIECARLAADSSCDGAGVEPSQIDSDAIFFDAIVNGIRRAPATEQAKPLQANAGPSQGDMPIDRFLAAIPLPQYPTELANEKLDSIKAALNEYYEALTARQHGGVAQSTAFNKIEQIMGTSWHDRKIEVTNK